MSSAMVLTGHILFWFVLMLIAIGNGTLREMAYAEAVGELQAHQISTVTGILFSGLAVWLFSRLYPLESGYQAWVVGISWLALTLAFEFIFGHFVMGHSWSTLLQDYNLLAGRLWPVFLLWTLAMPYVFYKVG